MPLIDIECSQCHRQAEAYRPLADWPKTPACPACGGPTTQVFLPPGYDRTAPPAVVVYRAPDGSFRFPGQDGGTSTAKYDRMGYERVEARGWTEVRHLERQMNRAEYSRACRLMERRQRASEEATKARRAELRHQMASMSDGGRSLGRALIRFNDQRERHPRTPDPGIHVSVYSNTKSNY